jgi:hypothetical protein
VYFTIVNHIIKPLEPDVGAAAVDATGVSGATPTSGAKNSEVVRGVVAVVGGTSGDTRAWCA